MQAEAASVAPGEAAAAAMTDGVQFYEQFDYATLISRAACMGFPLVLMLVAIAMYRAPRYLVMQSAVADPLSPRNGAIAGCVFAIYAVIIISAAPMQGVVHRNPLADIVQFVDDFTAGAKRG